MSVGPGIRLNLLYAGHLVGSIIDIIGSQLVNTIHRSRYLRSFQK